MLSNAIKLLFLAMTLVYVAARPEFEVPESYEMENDEMDREPRLKIPAPILTKPLWPCPFDCGKVCVVKYPFTSGNPPVSNIFYICHKAVHDCCKKACYSYQKCLLTKPEWACYADTLDYICKCRSISKPKFPFLETKGQKKTQ
ncbi:Hypothetical predicted protein [Paramuricea clavata]|uniref:Uncharacterized protein n=1 Tax=Paramuricea clavata TaxID=317549 RepID=A0A6S7HHK8_PARCT|nr:Hypothetical predicted protein [Paramuricea clavata]